MSDHELLQRYARENSQPAFATLVARHLDLVYSAARRQVRSPQLAEEVAQSVFIELSRGAAKLPATQPLAAWLYVVTRRTAVDALRQESRRLARETAAAEIAAMKTPPEAWSKVEASIDEAMATLNDTDRSAIILRFFQNLSLREVGESLGISEDTAQKRVSRALDRLRTFFGRRGVAVTAAGLATDLSAAAIHSAPHALATTITSSVASATLVTAANTAGVAAMTTAKNSIVAIVLVLAAGTGIYEATVFARQASEVALQQQQAAALIAQLQRADQQQTTAATRLKSVESQIDSGLAIGLGDAALESKLRGWQTSLAQLRDALKQRPHLSIPELQLLSDDDWFDAATKAKLDSDDDLRRALASLRGQATVLMGEKMRSALNAYLKANDGILPGRIDQLLPFFNLPIDPSWLERYEILRTGKLSELSNRDRTQTIGPKSFGDVEYDLLLKFGPIGFSEGSAMDDNVHQAEVALIAKDGGGNYTAADLVRYLKWPASEAAVQKILDAQKARTAGANPSPGANRPSHP